MIALGGCTKGTLDAISLSIQPEGQISTKLTALPGGVFLAAVFIQGLGLSREAVEHGSNKFRQSGLAETVGLLNHCQTFRKVQGILVKAAEIFNV